MLWFALARLLYSIIFPRHRSPNDLNVGPVLIDGGPIRAGPLKFSSSEREANYKKADDQLLQETIEYLPVSKIRSDENIRKTISEEALEGLTQSMLQVGALFAARPRCGVRATHS